MDWTNVVIVLMVLLIGVGLGIHLGFQIIRKVIGNTARSMKAVGKTCKKVVSKK